MFLLQSEAEKDLGSWPALSEMAEKVQRDETEVSAHKVTVEFFLMSASLGTEWDFCIALIIVCL